MGDTYKGISEAAYLTWLEGLYPGRSASLLPGILLESPRGSAAQTWADKFFSPLQHLNLFPFQGEKPWVEVVCTSWEDAAALPVRLARLCMTAAGLWGRFQGGVVVDLRWCDGTPQEGCLDSLVRFLLAGTGELCPLVLAAPGSAQILRHELRLLDLQQIFSQQSLTEQLEESLRQVDSLTQEEKEQILRQARQESPDFAASMARTLHRLTAMGSEVHVEQLLVQTTSTGSVHRKIGFEWGVET